MDTIATRMTTMIAKRWRFDIGSILSESGYVKQLSFR